MKLLKEIALTYLQDSIGNKNAHFHADQWEAIDNVVNLRKKLLVVQKTGWGKSSVYFISTKFLRTQGFGLSIIISPLLALMRNQIMSAKKLNLNVATINSSNTEDWDIIKSQILQNKIDALLISPERLANDDFMKNILQPIASKIGLFVIDEAHCISDWGHDFRPDYKRISNILKNIPSNTPILATTATANNRVIQDIESQINGLTTLRGSLKRESLKLFNIRLPEPSHRLAWLIEHVPSLKGSGIIYVLTQRDAKIVSSWLNVNGISAKAYYSGVENEDFESADAYRIFLEDQLLSNKIKVLVSTSALGMGFDKPDLSFVIHYQAPGSIISYYQQVGRAGRGIDSAHGILLSGHEDDDIHEFFRSSSFPSKENVALVLKILENSDGLSIIDIQKQINITQGEVEKTLKYLSVESKSPVTKVKSKWYRTPNHYYFDTDKIEQILEIRQREWDEIQRYIDTEECLMRFLQNTLNDPNLSNCGKCANCVEHFSNHFSHENGLNAANFLKKNEIIFTPKKQVKADALATYEIKGNIPDNLRAEEGRILSRWADAGWGRVVADNKHNGHFEDRLVDAMVELYNKWKPAPSPQFIVCVPSLNHPTLVPNFAKKIALKLNIPFVDAVKKIKTNKPQKLMNNSYYQAKNLDGVFEITRRFSGESILLVDDVIDSGWTITVISALLKQKGCGKIYPIALATTGKM